MRLTLVAATLALMTASAGLPASAANSDPRPAHGSTGAARPEAPKSADESPHRKMCSERHYSSSALCSDSTCKMREYRKWQTCLKTGSYD
jgi:hypothetical protein